MAIVAAMTTSFKVALFNAEMSFKSGSADTFKIALYTSAAELNAATEAYTTDGEVVGSGYTAGGIALTIAANPTADGTTAYVDFENPEWTGAAITARGALIYKDDVGFPSAAGINFGEDRTTSGGTFQIQMPNGSASEAILRLM
jgi:hypothetical protein